MAEDPKVEMYWDAVMACLTAGHLVSFHELPETLKAIERAETMGPILDPTLYRDKSQAMQEDAELLRAALPLWQLIKKRLEATGG